MVLHSARVTSALQSRDVNQSVATIAAENFFNIINVCGRELSVYPRAVYIYFDGVAPKGKLATQQLRLAYNAPEGDLCMQTVEDLVTLRINKTQKQYSITIVKLATGESELSMYALRDQNVNTNVFITTDTDIFNILYNHTPVIPEGYTPTHALELEDSETDTETLPPQANFAFNSYPQQFTRAIKHSYTSYNPTVTIKDSALLLMRSKDAYTFYSLDNAYKSFWMSPLVFRVFCGMCGSDYTTSVLTKSMCENVVKFEDHAIIKKINALEDVMSITISLLLVSTLSKFTGPMRSALPDVSYQLFIQYVRDLNLFGVYCSGKNNDAVNYHIHKFCPNKMFMYMLQLCFAEHIKTCGTTTKKRPLCTATLNTAKLSLLQLIYSNMPEVSMESLNTLDESDKSGLLLVSKEKFQTFTKLKSQSYIELERLLDFTLTNTKKRKVNGV